MLCARGHDIVGSNVVTASLPRLVCRICRNAYQRERYHARKAKTPFIPYQSLRGPRPHRIKEFCKRGHKMSETAKIKYNHGRAVQECQECKKIIRAQKPKTKQYNKRMNLWHQYRLTSDEYNRMLEMQDERCAICNKHATPLHVDHSHTTGKVRALLCRNCNHGLGNFRDDPVNLKYAMQYLRDMGI